MTVGALVVIALVSVAGTLRAFVVAGPSDAPTLWWDPVLVTLAAYQVHIPFTSASCPTLATHPWGL